MKIVVTGTGYVGLVTGVCLANVGHNVTCVDIDEKKVEMMQDGKSPIFEPDLEELMIKNKEKLEYTTNYEMAYKDADVIMIAVGTPEKKDGSANLSYIYEAAKQIAQSVEKDCIIVIKSTVPIGTNDKIENFIIENLKNEVAIEVVSNPEFLSQGTAIKDTLKAPRVVIGVKTKHAEKLLKEVYSAFNLPLLVTDRCSAEMVKYASNDFLALKISYINEIANLCEIVGANIDDVTEGMGMDPRIGNKFLAAGIGYGGSCFPKDTKALHWMANYFDYELKTIKAAIEINENQKIKLIKKARKYFTSYKGLNIAILGLTFKPGTDDLREAPSLQNIPILLEEGAYIKVWDPIGMENFKRSYPKELTYCETIDTALEHADICFIFTEWPEVKNFDIKRYELLMRTPLVLDGRNCYNLEKVQNTKMIYESVGRKTICNHELAMINKSNVQSIRNNHLLLRQKENLFAV